MDHNWTGADGRRAISILLAIAAGMAGLFGVLYGTAMVASAVGPDWSVIAGFIAFFILLGIAGAIVSSILRWGREGSYKILFPGYAGRKLPAFVLLDGPDAWKGFQSDGTMMWLGEAGDYFFALRPGPRKKGRKVWGEKRLHVGREPLKIAKSDIESVEVFDRSDEDIAE